MFHIVSFILFFSLLLVILFFLIGFTLISKVLRSFFHSKHKKSQETFNQTYQKSWNDNPSKTNNNEKESFYNTSHKKKNKKIFDDDEGEYIDFEEIKK